MNNRTASVRALRPAFRRVLVSLKRLLKASGGLIVVLVGLIPIELLAQLLMLILAISIRMVDAGMFDKWLV